MDGCVLTLVGFHTLGQAFYCGKSNISNKVHKSPPTQNEAPPLCSLSPEISLSCEH